MRLEFDLDGGLVISDFGLSARLNMDKFPGIKALPVAERAHFAAAVGIGIASLMKRHAELMLAGAVEETKRLEGPQLVVPDTRIATPVG